MYECCYDTAASLRWNTSTNIVFLSQFWLFVKLPKSDTQIIYVAFKKKMTHIPIIRRNAFYFNIYVFFTRRYVMFFLFNITIIFYVYISLAACHSFSQHCIEVYDRGIWLANGKQNWSCSNLPMQEWKSHLLILKASHPFVLDFLTHIWVLVLFLFLQGCYS